MEKVLVIVGPTGVGKTSLSIALAKQLHGEIISGDSMQVYQEMNIGTAKITDIERAGICHYLIDEYTFTQEYNVKTFQERSRHYMKEIKGKKKLPIICGGTGLYIKSAIYDYQFFEQKEDKNFVEFLNHRSEDELWSLLNIIDSKTCKTIHKHNHQRIMRALYIAHMGEKKSDLLEKQEHKPIYDAYIIGLTMERKALYQQIDMRVDKMMEEGLLDEMKHLVTLHDDVWSLQSFQGIGYKEWKPYFEGTASVKDCVEKIKKNTRNFAKRQYTWFHNQMDVAWYNVLEEGYIDYIKRDVENWMMK